jgi:hypothetical protein
MWRCPTPFRLWKYITTWRRSASTCTFGEAMCGVLIRTARTVDVTGSHRYHGVRQGMKTGTSGNSRWTGGAVTKPRWAAAAGNLKNRELEAACLR